MIVVTGGAGFIGSNLVRELNKIGFDDILLIDDLTDGIKIKNISDLNISDYLDKDDFLSMIHSNKLPNIKAVFHLGACSSTTEWNGKYMMLNNYEYSKALLHWCQSTSSQFLYASSASVYGLGKNGFQEKIECESPINIYAYSKFQFDQYVRKQKRNFISQVVGLRYFNVYGPGEDHKGNMSSPPLKFYKQILADGFCELFQGSDDFPDGQQMRDFIFVDDCVKAKIWFLENPEISGIFNIGTGIARSFNDVAKSVLNWFLIRKNITSKIHYIPFPDNLKGVYQSYTQADISFLRYVGFNSDFNTIEEGITRYLDWLDSANKRNLK